MARVFKLVRSGLSDLDFLAAAAAGLRAQKWAPAQAPVSYREIPAYVTEEIDFLVDRDSDDNLAATIRALDEYAAMAEMWWHDRTIYLPVWLHAKMDGETYTRRALVKNIQYSWLSDPIAQTGHAAAHDAVLRIQIERHPYWESDWQFNVPSSSGLVGASVVHDVSNTPTDGVVTGTVPARPMIKFRSSNSLLDRLWMGIRSEKHGNPANFLNIWECENEGLGTDAAVVSPDATASGNARVQVNFATTPGWAKRSIIRYIGDPNPEDQGGQFLELLRAKVDSGTTCEIYVKIGLRISLDNSFIIIGPTVAITNTAWYYYEMGEAVIPILNAQCGNFENHLGDPAAWPGETEIQIWARRTGGSGSLHLDCLCPMPIDEGYVFLSDMQPVSSALWIYYWQSKRDESVFYGGAVVMNRSPIISDHNFRFPPGEVRLICIFARAASSIITDNIEVDSAHFSRWASLRGAEGYEGS